MEHRDLQLETSTVASTTDLDLDARNAPNIRHSFPPGTWGVRDVVRYGESVIWVLVGKEEYEDWNYWLKLVSATQNMDFEFTECVPHWGLFHATPGTSFFGTRNVIGKPLSRSAYCLERDLFTGVCPLYIAY